MTPDTIPAFGRVEIGLSSKRAIGHAADALKELSEELAFIAHSSDPEETALILAHHRIKATSKKLRNGNAA